MFEFADKLLSSRRIGTLCGVLVAILFGFGWWPFAPFPKNHVHWVEGPTGLAFQPECIVYDTEPLPRSTAMADDFTVVLWLEAGKEPASGVSHVLTIDDGQLPSPLVLCQWKSQLLLRRPDPQSPRGFREVGVAALHRGQPVVVAITCASTGTLFYTNGTVSGRFPKFRMPANSLQGRLILGNAAGGKQSWTGSLFGFVMLGRSLNESEVLRLGEDLVRDRLDSYVRMPDVIALYAFTEGEGRMVRDLSMYNHQLNLPSRYKVLEKRFLELPWGRGAAEHLDRLDIVINIFGFIPLSFVLSGYCRCCWPGSGLRRIGKVVLMCALISILIELGQVWLPMRNSSMLDLICNTLGGLIGAVMSELLWKVGMRMAGHERTPRETA